MLISVAYVNVSRIFDRIFFRCFFSQLCRVKIHYSVGRDVYEDGDLVVWTHYTQKKLLRKFQNKEKIQGYLKQRNNTLLLVIIRVHIH